MTPDQELAKKIENAFVEAKLFSRRRAAEVSNKLATGAAKETDWRFWAEIEGDADNRSDSVEAKSETKPSAPTEPSEVPSPQPTKIKKLKLTKFRGATGQTTITFANDKSVTMIFGENGTGKSTIADSIDLVCNRDYKSVTHRSGFTSKHLPSIGHNLSAVEIVLETQDCQWTASFDSKGVTVYPLSHTPPPVRILRRTRLIQLVEATPSQRFDELRRFIDVSKIEACEGQLDSAIKAANSRLTKGAEQKQLAEANLRKLWDPETLGQSFGSPIAWAKQTSEMDINSLRAQSTQFKSLRDEAANLAVAADEVIRAIKDFAAELASFKPPTPDEPQPNLTLGEEEVPYEPQLQRLLTELAEYVAVYRSNSCIACNSPVDPDAMIAEIRSRITPPRLVSPPILKPVSLPVFSLPYDHTPSARKRLRERIASFAQFLETMSDETKALMISWDLTTLLPSDAWEQYGEETLQAVAEQAKRLWEFAENKFTATESDIRNQALAKTFYQEYLESSDAAKAAETELATLTSWRVVIRGQRLMYTQEILDDLGEECKRLYDSIHPHDKLSIQGFKMDEKQKASLLHLAKFGEYDNVAPQAYFSDAHLDTLGFCVWMAIASRESSAKQILVLDDIFTSVDSSHMRRIATMLEAEKDKYLQIIILTHYRQWQTYYRRENQNVQLIELHNWGFERGVAASGIAPDLEAVADLLAAAPFDRQHLASNVGILLEYYLDQISIEYRCSLPRNADDQYVLNDYYSGCTKLMKHLKVERPQMGKDGAQILASDGSYTYDTFELSPAFESLFKLNFIRNQVGCHFNISGDDISSNDIAEFGKLALEFVTLLSCPLCKTLALKLPKSAAHRTCACSKTRLTPPAKP